MKLAFIGAGNMGGATAKGVLKHSSIDPKNILIIDPSTQILKDFKEMGVERCHSSITESNLNSFAADYIIIGVKPWLMESVLTDLTSELNLESPSSSVIVSLAAGVSLDLLKKYTNGTKNCIRLIPNTAIEVGQSMSFMFTDIPNNLDIITNFKTLLSKLGQLIKVQSELELDSAMSLASCGLAFALRYIRASAEGGVELGIKPSLGHRIVAQTLMGAATLLLENNQHPEAEIDKITTPGGITIKGLNAMEAHGFTNAVIQGIKSSKA